MALKTNRGRPGEVSLTECPFCEEPIARKQSFSWHWPKCPDNPANGGASR